uniref:(northern house mosquito) hypothetical protein n=1 Tax=Culex pipiens TaxID=7175 RepID=A0A8D8CVM2_CULPI
MKVPDDWRVVMPPDFLWERRIDLGVLVLLVFLLLVQQVRLEQLDRLGRTGSVGRVLAGLALPAGQINGGVFLSLLLNWWRGRSWPRRVHRGGRRAGRQGLLLHFATAELLRQRKIDRAIDRVSGVVVVLVEQVEPVWIFATGDR